MNALHIQLLGDFQIRSKGESTYNRAAAFESPRLRSLLAYLLLHRDAPQSRKQIAFILWTDSSEIQARSNLRNLLHRLRRALPDAEKFLLADTQLDFMLYRWSALAGRFDVSRFVSRVLTGLQLIQEEQNFLWQQTQPFGGGGFTATAPPVDALLANAEAARFLNVNTFNHIVWFNKEAFEALLNWYQVVGAFDALRAAKAPSASRASLVEQFDALQTLRAAEAQSEYQVEKLLAALEKPKPAQAARRALRTRAAAKSKANVKNTAASKTTKKATRSRRKKSNAKGGTNGNA